jgi:hypothetical protein
VSHRWITLVPRFMDSRFDGYDQVDGTHFFDTAGKKYGFVPRDEYEKLRSTIKIAEDLLKVFTILPDPKRKMTLRDVAVLSLDALDRIKESCDE